MQATRFEGMMLSILFPEEPADATTREPAAVQAITACRLATTPAAPVRAVPGPQIGAKGSPRLWVCSA